MSIYKRLFHFGWSFISYNLLRASRIVAPHTETVEHAVVIFLQFQCLFFLKNLSTRKEGDIAMNKHLYET